MRELLEERAKLDRERKAVSGGFQNAASELSKSTLELELRKINSKLDIELVERTLFLINAYRETGSMTVVLEDGTTYTDSPYIRTSPIAAVRNIVAKAEQLARLSIGI